MHQSLFLASIIAVSGALALPQVRGQARDQVRVSLQNQAIELGVQTVFSNPVERQTLAPIGSSGPFRTVDIRVGEDVDPELRCQVLDAAGNPIVANRGNNTDITFSDANGGSWTFRNATEVSTIICDPAFEKADAAAFQVRVELNNQALELGSQTTFNVKNVGKRQTRRPIGSSGPFQVLELHVGALVRNQDLRCQLVDDNGEPIVVLRGENRDVTFSDKDGGPWDFENEGEVSNIICDPAFVASNLGN